MDTKTSKYEYINVEELTPFDRNPKQHPAKQVERIKRSIQEYGWTRPILAIKHNEKSMIVVGHGAHKAALELNLRQVPVVFLDLPYEKAIAYNVADNKLAELAEWDTNTLQGLLSELYQYDVDFEAMGFSDQEIGDLISGDFSYGETDYDEDLIDGEDVLVKFKVKVPLELADEVEEKLNELVSGYDDVELEKVI